MFFSLNHAGLNITNGKLQIVEVNNSNENFFLENIDEEFFSDFLNWSSKETKTITILQNAFDELILRKPLKTNIVSFTLPNSLFKIFDIPFDESLIDDDLREHIQWEVSQVIPTKNINDLLIQHIRINKNDICNIPTAIVFAIDKKYLKMLHKFCVRNNLILKYIDNAHIASNTFLKYENKNDDKLTVSLYYSDKILSVVLLNNNLPISFKINKLESQSELIQKLSETLDDLKIFGIDDYNKTKTYIFGDNISESLLQQIKDSLNISPIMYNPFKLISMTPELSDNQFLSKNFNSFSAAAGIAFRLV